jgi:hypothetical protein
MLLPKVGEKKMPPFGALDLNASHTCRLKSRTDARGVAGDQTAHSRQKFLNRVGDSSV